MDKERMVIISLEEDNSLIKKNEELIRIIDDRNRNNPHELKFKELSYENANLKSSNRNLKKYINELLYEKASLIVLNETILDKILERINGHFSCRKYIREFISDSKNYIERGNYLVSTFTEADIKSFDDEWYDVSRKSRFDDILNHVRTLVEVHFK